MGITILGVVTIILSIYAFFKNEKLLLYMLVFLSTFTAAEVFDVKVIGMPVLTFEYVGAIWLLRQFVNFIKSKPKFSKDVVMNKLRDNKLATALIIFLILMIIGEIYLLISGLSVEYTRFNGDDAVLKFSFSNIKQMLIVGFLVLLTIVLSFKIKTKEQITELLRVFAISTIFAIIWGFLQFITYYFKIPYPAFLFNNNDYAAQGYAQVSNNIKRICSIALEPSTFAINLICFIPFSLGAFIQIRDKIKSKKFIIAFCIIVAATVCAILTTSSTTYIGLVMIYGLYGLYMLFGFIRKGEMADRWKNILKIFTVGILSIAVSAVFCFVFVKIGYKTGAIDYIANPNVIEDGKENKDDKKPNKEYNSTTDNIIMTIKQMTIDKLITHSGQERTTAEEIGFSLFKHSPVVGIGLGSYRTFSLFTNILINMRNFRGNIILICFICCNTRNYKIQEEK